MGTGAIGNLLTAHCKALMPIYITSFGFCFINYESRQLTPAITRNTFELILGLSINIRGIYLMLAF